MSFYSPPAFGRRTARLGFGAENAKDALQWSVPDVEENTSSRVRAMRRASTALRETQAELAGSSTQRQLPAPANIDGWVSEARESFAFFQPAPIRPPTPPPREATPPPPPPPPTPPPPEPEPVRQMVEGGIQTDSTTVGVKTQTPPKPPLKPKARTRTVVKPPFHAYGRGNVTPVNSSNHLATYSINAALHKATEKDSMDIKQNGKHRVFDSALARLQYDPDAYSGRGLADAAARLAATQRGDTVHVAALRIVDPDDKEVVCIDIGNGRREVSIQRTSLALEDSILSYTSAHDSAGKPLDLALLELKSSRFRKLQGFGWGDGTHTVTVDHTGKPLQPYDPKKAKQKREAVKPPMAFGASLVRTQPRERPPPGKKGFDHAPTRDAGTDTEFGSGAGYLWSAGLADVPAAAGRRSIAVEREPGARAADTTQGTLSTSALDSSMQSTISRGARTGRVEQRLKEAPAGSGLLSRLGPRRPANDSTAAKYMLAWDQGHLSDSSEDEEQEGYRGSRRQSRGREQSGLTEASVISPRAGRRKRAVSSDMMHRQEQGRASASPSNNNRSMLSTGVPAVAGTSTSSLRQHASVSTSPTRPAPLGRSTSTGTSPTSPGGRGSPVTLAHTHRSAERYDGSLTEPSIDARLYGRATRQAGHYTGGGKLKSEEPDRVTAVVEAAALAGSSRVPQDSKVVLYGGAPVVVQQFVPTDGKRDPYGEFRPGGMVPAGREHMLEGEPQGMTVAEHRLAAAAAKKALLASYKQQEAGASGSSQQQKSSSAAASARQQTSQPAPVHVGPPKKAVAWVAGAPVQEEAEGSESERESEALASSRSAGPSGSPLAAIPTAGVPTPLADRWRSRHERQPNDSQEGAEAGTALALGRPHWPMTDKPWKGPFRSEAAALAESQSHLPTGRLLEGSVVLKASQVGGSRLTMSAIA